MNTFQERLEIFESFIEESPVWFNRSAAPVKKAITKVIQPAARTILSKKVKAPRSYMLKWVDDYKTIAVTQIRKNRAERARLEEFLPKATGSKKQHVVDRIIELRRSIGYWKYEFEGIKGVSVSWNDAILRQTNPKKQIEVANKIAEVLSNTKMGATPIRKLLNKSVSTLS